MRDLLSVHASVTSLLLVEGGPGYVQGYPTPERPAFKPLTPDPGDHQDFVSHTGQMSSDDGSHLVLTILDLDVSI